MPRPTIKIRLVVLFVVQIVIVLFVAGLYLQWQLRLILERELGAKLEAIAGSIASQMDPTLVLSLIPGDEDTRTYSNLRRRLMKVLTTTEANRVVIFSLSRGIFVDTDSISLIGQLYERQKIDQQELSRVGLGEKKSSVLFEGDDSRFYKTGYAPFFIDEKISGVVAVEGGAANLQAAREVQNRLFQVGLVAVIFSVIAALVLSGQITSPLKKLQRAAEHFSGGNLDHKVEVKGRDEIAFLGRTMDEMRRSILQRDERQRAMLAGVAHEIRNPLGGIELFASMLADELPVGEARENTEKILKETRNLKGIVQNFLDYAKPIVPKRVQCSVAECLSEARMFLTDELDNHDVRLTQTSDAQVFVDPQNLKQVFLNLMKNSIQSMPNGGKIGIDVKTLDRSAVITFTDEGSGIPAKLVDKVFDPFFTTKEKGLGLGLALVRNLVEENGGNIQLKSTGSHGTAFEITLPLS